MSINSQTTSKSVPPACDKTKPLRDPDDILDASIDLVDESEESLPCESGFYSTGAEMWTLSAQTLSFLASPISLSESDHEMELDVSFSRKIPVGFLPRETAKLVNGFSSQTEDRNTAYRKIRQTLHNIFMHGTGRDDKWHKLLPESSDETRYVRPESASQSGPVSLSRLLNPPRALSQVRCIIVSC